MNDANKARKHLGGCHCGAVRFEVEVDATKGGRCNCSVCTKVNQLGAMVKPDQLRLLTPESALGAYVWGAKISTRYFCKTFGIHCFGKGHLAELGGDFASVNLQCLDDVDPATVTTIHWDGRHDNWEGGPRSTPWPIAAS